VHLNSILGVTDGTHLAHAARGGQFKFEFYQIFAAPREYGFDHPVRLLAVLAETFIARMQNQPRPTLVET
jgi:hypothetical protein